MVKNFVAKGRRYGGDCFREQTVYVCRLSALFSLANMRQADYNQRCYVQPQT